MMDETRRQTCCFTGHRPSKLPWGTDESSPDCLALKAAIADALAIALEEGCRHFICGMAAGSDLYFAEAVVALRGTDPSVTLEAAVPFRGQAERWSRRMRTRYDKFLAACDRVTVLMEEYAPGCMMARNRYMVDRSSLLIAVYDGQPGGTRNTIRYAADRGLMIVQLPVAGLPAGL